jgi:hypothetical protein
MFVLCLVVAAELNIRGGCDEVDRRLNREKKHVEARDASWRNRNLQLVVKWFSDYKNK